MFPNAIPGLNIYMYGVMIAIGILACFGVLFYYSKKKNFDSNFIDFVFYNGVVAIGLGFLMAQVMHTYYIYRATGEWDFPTGFSFLGGLMGGAISFIVGYFIFRKRLKHSIIELFPLASICILIAHAFGRLGCLCAGCCHGELLGREYVFGGIYMLGKEGWGYYVPTQLYEALFLFIMFAIFSIRYLKYNDKNLLSYYLFGYGLFRFIIEFVRRDNDGKFVGTMTPSQFWSLVMIVLGIALFFLMKYVFVKHKHEYIGDKQVATISESDIVVTDTQIEENSESQDTTLQDTEKLIEEETDNGE